MNGFHAAMILAATILMQTHGIRFWSDFVGPDTGWLWSVVLEGAALWLWANRKQGTMAPLLASFLVLSGPLLHIIQPPLDAWVDGQDAQVRQVETITEWRSEIVSLEGSLATSLRNSANRVGWLNDIQETRKALQIARQQLRAALDESPTTQGLWPWFKAIMQAMALIVIWSVSVMAIAEITKLRAPKSPSRQPAGKESQSARKVETPASVHAERTETNLLAMHVNQALDKVLEAEKITQAEWGNRKGFTPKNISLVRGHARRVSEGKELAPLGVIQQMAATLGVKQATGGSIQ